MPGERSSRLAPSTRTGTAAHPLCAPRLHPATGTRPTRAPEQARDLQPALPGQCRNPAGDRSRSPPPGRGDRLLQRAPYLEPATPASSPRPLRGRRGRPRSRSHALDPVAPQVLPPCQGAQPRLSRQVRRRTEDRLPPGQARLLRPPRTTCRTKDLRRMAPIPVPPRVGRLCQAALRRTGTRAALSQRLHPPRRHLQPQTRRPGAGQRHLLLARLRTRQQAATPDSAGRRVPAPLPAPPAATRLHAHPQLRIPRQPATRFAVAALLPAARKFSRHLCSNHIACRGSSLRVYPLELSCLWRLHARRRTALRSSTAVALSTPHPPVCRMSLQLQPRSLRMLWHAQCRCVSSRPRPLQDQLSSPPGLPQDTPTLHTPWLQSTELARRTTHTRHPHHLSQIENT